MAKEKSSFYPDKEFVDWILNNKTEAQSKQEKFYKQLDSNRKQYNNQPKKDRPYEGVANTFVPETFKNIQTKLSRIMYYLIGNFWDIKDNKDCPPEVRQAYKDFIDDQLITSRWKIETQKLFLSTLKNGMGICKVFEKSEKISQVKPVNLYLIGDDGLPIIDTAGKPVIAGQEDQVVVTTKKYPALKLLNWRNISVVGNIDDFYDADMIIERVENVDWEELYNLRKRKEKTETGEEIEQGVYINLDKAITDNVLPQGTITDEKRDDIDDIVEFTPKEKDVKTENSKHVLDEAWGYYDIDGDGQKELCIFTILDEQLLIRKQRNPFNHGKMPYLYCPNYIQDDDWKAKGDCEITEKTQDEINAKRNQFLDNATLNLRPPKIVTDSSIPDSQLVSRPDQIIRSNRGRDAVIPLPPSMFNMQAGTIVDQTLKDDMAVSMAALKSMQGVQLSSGTATEYKGMVEEGNYRIMLFAIGAEACFLYPYFKMHHSLNQQFEEEEITRTVKGKDGQDMIIVIGKKDMRFDFDFDIKVLTAVENKTVKTQQAQNYLSMLQGLLGNMFPPQMLIPAIVKIAKRIWSWMDISNDELFPPGIENMPQQAPPMPGQIPGQPGPETVAGVNMQARPPVQGVPNGV